jgi:hypothetical protein
VPRLSGLLSMYRIFQTSEQKERLSRDALPLASFQRRTLLLTECLQLRCRVYGSCHLRCRSVTNISYDVIYGNCQLRYSHERRHFWHRYAKCATPQAAPRQGSSCSNTFQIEAVKPNPLCRVFYILDYEWYSKASARMVHPERPSVHDRTREKSDSAASGDCGSLLRHHTSYPRRRRKSSPMAHQSRVNTKISSQCSVCGKRSTGIACAFYADKTVEWEQK